MTRRDRQECDEPRRSAHRRKNALRARQRAIGIRGNELCRGLAGLARADASVAHIDLTSGRSILNKIRGIRAESHVTPIRTHRRRVTVTRGGLTIIGNREQRSMWLAASGGALAGIAEIDL